MPRASVLWTFEIVGDLINQLWQAKDPVADEANGWGVSGDAGEPIALPTSCGLSASK